jgi:tripartite-type tricarboxylate transporter receptor subunit TctC
VPYKGGAPAATAVAAGDVQFGVIALPGATPHLKSGRAKVAGITTAKKWAPEPAWSTPRDAGLDVDASIWSGLFAPKGTPQAIVDRLNAEVRKTLEQPDVRARLGDAGFEAAGMSQADTVARIRKDLARYREIVKAAGVKAE